MSTHFDGVDGTRIEATPGPLASAGTVPRMGIAAAALWRPLAVEASGLIKVGSGNATINPFSDGRVYFTLVAGTFVHGGQGAGAGQPGEFYTATDGYRIDMFTTHDDGSVGRIRRHTYFYDTATWTHADVGSSSSFLGTLTFENPVRMGSFDADEAGLQNIAALAIWATGGSLTDIQVETMVPGLYAWKDLGATALWSLEDATTLTIDPLGQGIGLTASAGISHSTDDPPGWTYATSQVNEGALVGTFPELSGTFDGLLSSVGTLAADLPSPTTTFAGVSSSSGQLVGSLPALVGSFVGQIDGEEQETGVRITVQEAQAWAEPTKLTIQEPFITANAVLLEQIEEEILARVSSAYDTSEWTNATNTPKLIRVAIAKKFVAWAYRRQYSEDITETDAAYSAHLDANAEVIIQGIIDGSIEIPTLPPSTTSTPVFYPNDASSIQEPTIDDPSLGPAKFSMGLTF